MIQGKSNFFLDLEYISLVLLPAGFLFVCLIFGNVSLKYMIQASYNLEPNHK